MNYKKGFTLIELLVVIAIIGLLSSVVLASLNSARLKARNVQRISNLTEIRKALEMYYSDNGAYPTSTGMSWQGECVEAGITRVADANSVIPGLVPNYISQIPQDPSFIRSNNDMKNCTYYRSNGKDYAYPNLYINDAGFSSSSYPTFIDPRRPSGWKIYSPGGSDW